MTYTVILTDPHQRIDHQYTVQIPTDNHAKAISRALAWARKARTEMGWEAAEIKLIPWTREEVHP